MTYEYKESYKHLYAKKVLAQWLREIEQDNEYCELKPFRWRSNWGIYTELPFYETSDAYYFEVSGGIKFSENTQHLYESEDYDSIFDTSFDRGKLLFVPDITIFHKGTPAYFIEVVHTHPVTDEKLWKMKDFIQPWCGGSQTELWEVEAETILKQIQRPERIKAEQLDGILQASTIC